MKKSKAISFLLSLSILASMIIPGTLALPASADDTPEDPKKGMEISKTATPNKDGTYTITLEAYATGEKISTEVTKDVPTDIVLVLDQSGSMTENMNTYGFRAYTNRSNNDYYDLRHNGGSSNLYHQLEDGSYVTVSVERTQTGSEATYKECPENWRNSGTGNDNYWANSNNLYSKVGDGYQKVTLTRGGTANREFTYTFEGGGTFTSRGRFESPGDFDGRGPLYVLDGYTYEYRYTYSYTDKDGTSHQIGTSDGAGTHPTDFTLYQRYSTGSVTRLQALQTAVTNFSNSVATKAAGKDGQLGTDDDVDHRIAVVGYASRADSNNPWVNTELFIGAVQHNYKVDASSYYGSAFQDMSTKAGQSNVNASIKALDANGATYTNYGLEMANGILNANPVPINEKRNRVIILFSDGYPGQNADDFNETAAKAALAQATLAKNSGVSVYAVGIFNGADATSPGKTNGNNTQAANWFMQNVSSNNGKPQTPSYYLSASDADTLNSIFQQISDNIQEGGSAIDLGSEAVIKDIISPQFQLPADATAANITLETWKCTGKMNDKYIWTKNETAIGAEAAVDGAQVSVTGFDFAENWCGTETTNDTTTYRGNKLVISFKVAPKDDFLGGNDVYTNTSAGIYENGSAENPLLTFDRPTVNVPIKDVTVTAADKNVYLKGEVTADQLKGGSEISVGNVKLDLTKDNYGLADWQTEYVDITVTVKDKDGNVISDKLENLTEDTTYTVEVTVAPKTPGTSTPEKGDAATAKTGANDPAANIYVFKPKLTFMDSEVYYGDTAPTVFSDNLVSTSWLHGTTVADTTKMGEAPTLTLTYTPDASKIKDGRINTKDDIPVAVVVKILNNPVNSYITFVHQACDPACGWTTPNPNNGNPVFLLHVKTCQLKIVKTATEGTTIDQNQTFVFKITNKNGIDIDNNNGIDIDMEVVIKGTGETTIKGLPVGEYTVEEDTKWSWRYTPELQNENPKTVDVNAERPNGNISFTNSLTNNQWLSGNSYADNNVTTDTSSGVNVKANKAN